MNWWNWNQVSNASADMGRPMPQMSSRPVARRTAGCTSSHQNDQNASHSRGMSASLKPALLQQALPDVEVVGRAAHRQPVQGLLAGPCVEQHVTEASASGSNRFEKWPMASERSTSRSSKAHLASYSVRSKPKAKSGGRPGLERRLDLVRKLCLGIQDKLDLLAAPLLERCDHLPDRLALLGIVALVPPHDEVGGPGAEAAP